MNAPAALPTVPVTVRTVDADTVFAALGDSTRRRILLGLSDGKPRTATAAQSLSGQRLSATIKNLAALRNAGLVVTSQDPVDGRRQAYSLAPSVVVQQTPDGKRTLDFGYCLVRF